MREIKYKIIYKNKLFGYERLTEKGWEWNVIELNQDNGERWCKGTLIDSERFIRLQFTGFYDKHGKEIYEGDICKVEHYNHSSPNATMIQLVHFDKGTFLLKSSEEEIDEFITHCSLYNCLPPNKIEIIGNLYETPELLNTK